MQRCMNPVLQAGVLTGVNGKRNTVIVKVKERITTRRQQQPTSGCNRIHGQCSHEEVVFDMALVSAVICMQVLHEIVANAMIRKFWHLQQKREELPLPFYKAK